MDKSKLDRLADDLISTINYYVAEWEINYGEILGAIEIAKLETQKSNQIFRSEEEDA